MSELRDALASGSLDPLDLGILESWRPISPLWRVYSQGFGPTNYNCSRSGYARFSPLTRPDGSVVPTLYAGTTLEVALMEIVLRDVPTPSAGFQLMLPERDAEQRRVTELVLHHPLRMIDFGAIGLRRMGLDRSTVIDCDSSDYPVTQMLGAWVYANTAAVDASNIVHGMVWTSRQDDSGLAAIFFGDRLSPASIESKGSGRSLHEGHIEAALLRLALRLGISIVAG